jgi:hypothetical protein
MAIPPARQPGRKHYRVLEAKTRANIEEQMNEVAADGYHCIRFVVPENGLFIAVMEAP